MDDDLRLRLDAIESVLHRVLLEAEAAKKAAERAEAAVRAARTAE
jgi:hypothetical protein